MSSFGDGSRIARLETPKIEARGLETPRIDRLVSFGSSIVDITAYLPKLPDRGGDVLATDSAISVGGSFNLESAAARLGLAVVHTAPIGVGPNADLVRRALADEAIELASSTSAGEPSSQPDTGFCITMVEPSGERTFVTSAGAEAQPSAIALAAIELSSSDAIYISGYDLCYPMSGPVLISWLLSGPKGQIFFDPGPLVGDIPAEAIDYLRQNAYLISCNRPEFEVLKPQPTDRALLLRRSGPDAVTVFREAQQVASVDTVKVSAVDTTGAGDVHLGALIASLAERQSFETALYRANLASAYSIQKLGGATAPSRSELAQFEKSLRA